MSEYPEITWEEAISEVNSCASFTGNSFNSILNARKVKETERMLNELWEDCKKALEEEEENKRKRKREECEECEECEERKEESKRKCEERKK